MTTILLRKDKGSYSPIDDAGVQMGHKIKEGAVIVADVSLRDNGTDQQRKYAFALSGVLFEAQDAFDDAEAFRYYLTCRVGYADVKNSPDGPIPLPKSWARGKMDKAEWIGLIDRIIDFGVNVFGLNRDDLQAEAKRRMV